MDSEDALRRQRELEPIYQQQRLGQERDIQDRRLKIEADRVAGTISQQEANRQQKELDRQSREEIAGLDRASREKIAGNKTVGGGLTPYQQYEIENKRNTNRTQRVAKLKEASDAESNAQIYENNANTAAETLARERASEDGITETRAKQLTDEIQTNKDNAEKVRVSGRKARADAEAIPNEPVPPQSAPTRGAYSGKRFSRAKVADRAKQLGMTPEQAEKTITDGGGIIY
jgi:hypothetical protein